MLLRIIAKFSLRNNRHNCLGFSFNFFYSYVCKLGDYVILACKLQRSMLVCMNVLKYLCLNSWGDAPEHQPVSVIDHCQPNRTGYFIWHRKEGKEAHSALPSSANSNLCYKYSDMSYIFICFILQQSAIHKISWALFLIFVETKFTKLCTNKTSGWYQILVVLLFE